MRLPSFRTSTRQRGESLTELPAHRFLRYIQEGKHPAALHLLLTETTTSTGGAVESNNTNKGDDHGSSYALRALLDQCTGILGEPVLHHLLKHHPSADLVNFLLSQACAHPVADDAFFLDSQGWTPLHVAVTYGCSQCVLECLLYDHYGASMATIQDACGRYPLHWACLGPLDHRGGSRKRGQLTIVSHVLHAFPKAAYIRDKDGNTPLDLARAHRASSRVVNLLLSQAFTLSVAAAQPTVKQQHPTTHSPVPRAVSSDSSSWASQHPRPPSRGHPESESPHDGVSSLGWE